MGDSLTCPECGADVDSAEQLEAGHEVHEVEQRSDGTIRLYENRNLLFCKQCKKPLGIARS